VTLPSLLANEVANGGQTHKGLPSIKSILLIGTEFLLAHLALFSQQAVSASGQINHVTLHMQVTRPASARMHLVGR